MDVSMKTNNQTHLKSLPLRSMKWAKTWAQDDYYV